MCRELARKKKFCEARGTDDIFCKGRLEWSHFETRSVISIRYEEWNYALWCSAHHWYYDKHPVAKAEWIKKNRGIVVYNRIKNYKPKNGEITEQFYLNKIEELKAKL